MTQDITVQSFEQKMNRQQIRKPSIGSPMKASPTKSDTRGTMDGEKPVK